MIIVHGSVDLDYVRAERIVRRAVPASKSSTCNSGREEEQCLGEVMRREKLTVVRRRPSGGWSGLSLEEEADAAAMLLALEKNEDQMRNEVRTSEKRYRHRGGGKRERVVLSLSSHHSRLSFDCC